MQMTRELVGGIHSMCNVGQGITERAYARGIMQGEKQMLIQQIQKKLEKNFSLEAIAEALEIDIEKVRVLVAEL